MLGSGLNIDSLLNSYKVDLTIEKPSLDPLVVLSDDEDINDYMEKTDENDSEPVQPQKREIEAFKCPDVNMATEKDPKMNELTETVEKGSGIILPLMMVSILLFNAFHYLCVSSLLRGRLPVGAKFRI